MGVIYFEMSVGCQGNASKQNEESNGCTAKKDRKKTLGEINEGRKLPGKGKEKKMFEKK